MSGGTGVLRRLLSSYALPNNGGRVIATGVVVYATSSGLYLAGGTVYFVKGIGLSTAQIGTGLTIAGLVGFLTTVPVSMLATRWGPLRLLRLLQAWRAIWFVALAFAHSMVAFTLFASLFAISQGPIFPMVQLLVNAVAGGEDRTRILGVISSVINVGMSVGALAAAPFLIGSAMLLRVVLLAGAGCCLASAGVFGLLKVGRSAAEERPTRWHSGVLSVVRDRRYLGLTLLNGVMFLHTVLLGIGLPLWLVQSTNAPAGLLSVLFTVNTVLAIAFQVQFAKNVRSSHDGTRALRNSGFALAAFSLALIATTHSAKWLTIVLLLVATALLTCGELLQGAGGWELSYRHAPEAQRTEYLSVFSLGTSAAGIVGPALLALLLSRGTAGLIGLAALFLVTAAAVSALGGRLARTERQRQPTAAEPAPAAGAH
ncbi:MFS transporter [Streptacidiphilus sp. P02-A3a]|uniref:MFS transporter n=1 Tax=Streptacidiphilus sp. P02-A3a TaxID=2704468 RepID=UPI0015FB69B3|nr:MFS transporter [Streptacidiphilus sp. P02-A3a]QMU71381.1 MFS transporter [Streptacidiphilus sp. P02-A3a]